MPETADRLTERSRELARKIAAAGLPQPREERGLPRLAEDIFRRRSRTCAAGRLLAARQELAVQLDLAVAGWPEAAMQLIIADKEEALPEAAGQAASLLALRPLTFAGPLCEALVRPANARTQELAALALLGTDTPQVRSAVKRAFLQLAGRCLCADCSEYRTLWTLFVRLAHEKRLSYDNLLLSAIKSQIFHPEGYRPRAAGRGRGAAGRLRLHPALDRCGLSAQPEFCRLYAMLVAEIMPTVAEESPWKWVRWIRCFAGQDYFFEALEQLDAEPNNLYALFVARWAQRIEIDTPDFADRLAGCRPLTLMLVSLLRRDVREAAGKALGSPWHAEALAWAARPATKAAQDELTLQTVIAPWADEHAALLGDAAGVLCSVQVPAEEPGAKNDAEGMDVARLQAFHRLHLVHDFANLMDNLLLLAGLRGQNIEGLQESARAGRLAAVRALGLAEGLSEEGMRLLLGLRKSGGAAVRRAAVWSLERIAARFGLEDIGALTDKLDRAVAWEDAGLADAPSRVWWDIAGYRVKLSVAQGKVELSAWGPDKKKAIPAKVRAHPAFTEVQQARRTLGRAYRIFRHRLEESMTTGGVFSGAQLRALWANPAFRSLAERLVFSLDGRALICADMETAGLQAALREGQWARVIHPMEMWQQGDLEAWQEGIANRFITQPFKQCFREIYPPEPAEAGRLRCGRFAEQYIIARKAYALLKRRGYSPCNGEAYRDWPEAGVRARFVWSQEQERVWEHLVGRKQNIPLVTGDIYFTPLADAGGPDCSAEIALEQVDPVVFSETLRDADLVVSTAAAGEEGFSSRQTMQIRGALVRNFARLLNLAGVSVDAGASHAYIKGELASYRIHLGSGRILVEPAGKHLPRVPPLANFSPLLAEESTDSKTVAILEAVAALAHDAVLGDAEFLAAVAGARAR